MTPSHNIETGSTTRRSALCFCEVMSGVRSQNFAPTAEADITVVAERKPQACLAHRTQLDAEWHANVDKRMEPFRRRESGHERAVTIPLHCFVPNFAGSS